MAFISLFTPEVADQRANRIVSVVTVGDCEEMSRIFIASTISLLVVLGKKSTNLNIISSLPAKKYDGTVTRTIMRGMEAWRR